MLDHDQIHHDGLIPLYFQRLSHSCGELFNLFSVVMKTVGKVPAGTSICLAKKKRNARYLSHCPI